MKFKVILFILTVTLILILGGILLKYDHQLSALAQSLPNAHSAGTFWGFGDKYGEWPTWIIVISCLLVYLVSLLTNRWTHYRPYLLFILFTALVSPIIMNRALKAIIHRPRPSSYMFPDSFPSGHTASAFVLFAFTYLVPKTKPALKVLTGICLGAWGMAIGVSRVIWGAHYPSDVLGGAFLTLMTEFLLWRWVFRRKIDTI